MTDEEIVERIARKYIDAGAKKGLGLVDLIELGEKGLETARERFDVTRGFRWETYLTWWVRQSITARLSDPPPD